MKQMWKANRAKHTKIDIFLRQTKGNGKNRHKKASLLTKNSKNINGDSKSAAVFVGLSIAFLSLK